ncbi:DNA methyltransferase [Geobacillus virus E3]|uniref:DNA methyltransferase n=1 Tax=Geobacillus virus E3 TaxID=1572712 RepID=UPI0006719AC6|nr:DNA methyltransferase [Geobacillus virus E3]AJA41408.1 putative DNA-cytosine methyltransferase [Geobacillus virus E3]
MRGDNLIELNKIYFMDNLELMKRMKDESVDLIYCDILYNTGKKFKDYNDNLGTPQEAIEWYRPRIIEMKRILTNNGIICLHMDWRLNHYIKILMDDIFGYKKFINEIIWNYGTPSGGRTSGNKLVNTHDYILVYSKTNNYKFNKLYTPYDQKYINEWFRYEDENGKYRKRWRGKDKNGNPIYEIQYLKDSKGIPLSTVWSDIQQVYASPVAYKNKEKSEITGYYSQKPMKLLERIIKLYSNENDIVADFFCGSGTTLVVAKKLDRQYIGCDINPRAVEITKKRLKEIDIIK